MRPLPVRAPSPMRLVAMVLALVSTSVGDLGAQASGSGLEPVASVEGITEYRLENGLRVLLFPDPSQPQVTVNITYLVGSQHEAYGETGMAHLLEHLLFQVALLAPAAFLDQTVGKRRLAVIDMGDDRKIADMGEVCHGVQSLSPQNATGAFLHLGGNSGGDSVDPVVGQCGLDRLQGDGDGNGFLASGNMFALVNVENADIRDEILVGARGGADDIAGGHIRLDDEGEIAVDRLERREAQQRPRGAPSRFSFFLIGHGDQMQIDDDADRRAVDIHCPQHAGVNIAERRQRFGAKAQHTRPAEP